MGARSVVRSTQYLHADRFLRARTEGIDVQIGRRPYAKTIHISQAFLEAVPILRRQLCAGAKILNVDPYVFKTVLQYLGQNIFLACMPLGVRNPLGQLTSGIDPMLNLVKAYHLARMLDHLQLQNNLIDIFSIEYRHLLRDRVRMQPSPEAFHYLRNHVGTYSGCERFMIEFYAGLAARTETFTDEDLKELPHDIARQLRWGCMHVLEGYGDRVLQGHECFRISGSHRTRCGTNLHVVLPRASSPERSRAMKKSSS